MRQLHLKIREPVSRATAYRELTALCEMGVLV